MPGAGNSNFRKQNRDKYPTPVLRKNTPDRNQPNTRRLLEKARKNGGHKLLPALHDEAFTKTDCLACAGCCKGYSPRFKTPEIARIAKFLGQKESAFIDQYLKLDEENDFVTTKQPCPFLGQGNLCQIYEVRPADCRRFPYTDEDILLKKPALTEKNATFCPAVQHVVARLSAIYGQ